MTAFEKTRLPHTSNFPTLMQCNFVCECANDLKILNKSVVAYRNDYSNQSQKVRCVWKPGFLKSSHN